MNTAVNEYNYRFKLTDYSLFDRNRARKLLFMVVFQQNTKHSYLHWKISYNGMMTK